VLLDSVPLNLEESGVGQRGYPPEFRRKVLDLVEAGRPIAEVAKALGISAQSIYTWRRQDRIDRGVEPGLTSAEKGELAAAKRRIAELETELRAMRRAMELVREVVRAPALQPQFIWCCSMRLVKASNSTSRRRAARTTLHSGLHLTSREGLASPW
jgi:transposase-like protein